LDTIDVPSLVKNFMQIFIPDWLITTSTRNQLHYDDDDYDDDDDDDDNDDDKILFQIKQEKPRYPFSIR